MRIGLGLQVGRVRGRNKVSGGGASDSTPDAFSFTDVTGSVISTVNTSNTITVTGIDTTSAISITGGTYSINGGAYTASAGTVVNNDTVTVRVTSSGSDFTDASAVITIGGVTDTWTVKTQGPELVTNGTGTDATGWLLTGVTIAASSGTGAGQFQLTSTVASGAAHMRLVVTTTVSAVYRVQATVRRGTAVDVFLVAFSGSELGNTGPITATTDTNTTPFTFTAPATNFTFYGQMDVSAIGQTGFFDNMSCRRIS